MSLKSQLASPVLAGLLFVSGQEANAQVLYDDFSSGSLDSSKWQVRKDVENQPFMDDYGVRLENDNYVFHTQNAANDQRVYLFPTRTFTTGDIIEYDSNLTSRDGTYAQMTLVTGSQYYRLGMRGQAAGFDEFGTAHNKITFQENLLAIERTTPSGNIIYDNLPLSNANGTYELYIGSFVNGSVHMDLDNFQMTAVPEPAESALAAGLLCAGAAYAMRRRRNNKSD